jgi:hypothetical protein
MYVDDRVLTPGVVKDALGGGGLSGVDVGDDPDVTNIGKGCCTGHGKFPKQFLG